MSYSYTFVGLGDDNTVKMVKAISHRECGGDLLMVACELAAAAHRRCLGLVSLTVFDSIYHVTATFNVDGSGAVPEL